MNGTFAGLAEGASVIANGIVFHISYVGGTGNDVVLTAAVPAMRTWTGAVSALWSDAGNWGGTAPVEGDALVFPLGALNTTNTNDFPAGTLFNSVTFQGCCAPYVLTGNAIALGPGGLTTSGGMTLSLAVTLAADQTWSTIGFIDDSVVTGAIHLGGRTFTLDTNQFQTLTLSGPIDGSGALVKNGFRRLKLSGANSYAGPTTVRNGELSVLNPTGLGLADGSAANGTHVLETAANATYGATLILGGVAVGNEALILENAAQSLSGGIIGDCCGPSSLAGPVTLAAGSKIGVSAPLTLSGVVSGPGPLVLVGLSTGTLTLANGNNSFGGGVILRAYGSPWSATLVIGADQAVPGTPAIDLLTTANALVLNGHAQTLAAVMGVGTLNTSAAPGVLTLNGSGDATFAGPVTGTGAIVHSGTGRQAFTGTSTFSGPLSVDHGIVTVSGTLPATVTVNNDGRLSLAANGTVGPVTVNDGRLQLTEGGAATGNTGAVTLDAGATVDIAGAAPAALGRLRVAGTVTLGGATLSLQLPGGFTPAVGATFTIIENDGGDAVSGTFAGLAEGGTLVANGRRFHISYIGDTGNDVVLTALAGIDYFLTEGGTGTFFTTDLLLVNPGDDPAPLRITFLRSDGTTVMVDETLPATSHKSIRVNDVPGMEATEFSTVVRSIDAVPIAVERTMSWDREAYGAHTERATEATALQWYFAEGSQGFFHTYLLLVNPQATANRATVQYLRELEPPLTRTYDLAPTSRLTVDAGLDTELAGRAFGMTVTFDQPGAAERAMYFGDAPLFDGGHESAGVTAPSATWFLAEGATGLFFETFVLLANPNGTAATATITYLPVSGPPVTAVKTIPAHARVTVNVEEEAPSLADAAVSITVAATQPILVERSQYWPDPAPNWREAHNSFGVEALGTRWALAEGRVGGATHAQTYVLIANPGATVANVTIRFLRDNGAPAVTKTFAVQPASRFNLPVGPGTSVPELMDERFGALITSDQPIAVERALYWDSAGRIWAAGTNAAATRLP